MVGLILILQPSVEIGSTVVEETEAGSGLANHSRCHFSGDDSGFGR
jgi:hypothetical protein